MTRYKALLSALLIGHICITPALLMAGDKPDEAAVVVTQTIGESTVYGERWIKGDSMDIADAITGMAEGDSLEGKFSGRITSVCQKKGCWMILENNGQFARVDFNNHAFFIPRDSTGPAEVVGTLKLKRLSEAKRAHLAEDGAGELPVDTWEIVATSVKIG